MNGFENIETIQDIKKTFDRLASYDDYFKIYCSKNNNFQIFPQTWPSQSLGFGYCAGDMMTTDLTVVIKRSETIIDIFFGGLYAYTVNLEDSTEEQKNNFLSDIEKQNIVSVPMSKEKYGAYRNGSLTGKYNFNVNYLT